MWVYFKAYVQGNIKYNRISERIIDLTAADTACQQKHGKGLIELAIENDLLDEQDLEDAKNLEEPGKK